MSLELAGILALVGALALLYLGLVRVHYDVRQLRRLVLQQADADRSVELRLPATVGDLFGRTVLAVSSTCATCWAALDEARDQTARGVDLVVLTYQDAGVFAVDGLDGLAGLQVVRSAEAWSVLSHLSPPVLARVGHDGLVLDLVLPTGAGEVAETLTRWQSQEVGS